LGCLYKITFENGKSYIGYTTKTIQQRIGAHIKAAKANKQLLIHKAIRKFDYVFKVEVLKISDCVEELCKEEVKAIKENNSLCPFGYNLTTGGEKSYSMCKYSREKISKRMLGDKRRLGTKHSEEAKELMRKAKIGSKLSAETKKRMSLSRLKFYSSEENLKILVNERKSRHEKDEFRKAKFSCLAATYWAKRQGRGFCEIN